MRKRVISIILIILGMALLAQSMFLIYKDYSPRDQQAATPSLKTKKWNPGHYLQGYPLDHPPAVMKKSIADDPKLQAARGVRVPISWKAFEPTKGNYNWKLVDDYLDAIGPDRQMFFHWWATDIWNKNCDSATRIPTYMLPSCTKMYSGTGVHGNASVQWWEPGPRAEMIRVLKAIGSHYDNNPQFEGIMFDETTFGIPPSSLISASEFEKKKLESYKIIHTEIAPYFAKSQVIQPMNWLGGAGCTELRELTNHLKTLGHGISNPDSPPWKALPRGCGTPYTNAPEAKQGDNTSNLWYSIAVYTIYREYKNQVPIVVGGDTSQFENPLVSQPRIFNKVPMNMANLVDMLYKQAVPGYTYTPTGEQVPGFGANYILWSQNFGNPSTTYTLDTAKAYRDAFYPIITDPNRKTNTSCPSNIKCLGGSGGDTQNPTTTPGLSPTPINTILPTATKAPVPTNTGAPANTKPPANTNTPSATTPQGNICGKADTDGNGVFTIGDFSDFARAYGNGKNTCADKDVDYAPCGGRDVNRDGVLNIFDFGGPGVGFAQRYYPKTSCALN